MSDPLEGAVLAGQFTVERKIGAGGMATVYLARDERHGRRVAIKVLRPDAFEDTSEARFHKEVDVAARLNHPHVLPLYTSGEHDGRLYFVMPFVEDDTLGDRIERESRLPVEDAVRIAAEVADGLDYAHGEGVVHRDIKPANLFLIKGHAVIADFGVARAMGQAHGVGTGELTRTGMAIGTPLYMSPEQALEGVADERSDVYSLGCVLYETLTGEPPLLGSTVLGTLARRQLERATAVSDLRDDVGPELDAVIQRALESEPEARFATAAEFREHLLDVLGGLRSGPRTTATSVPFKNRMPASMGRWVVLAGGVGAAALAIPLINGAMGPRPIEALAVLPFDDLGGGAADDAYFVDGVVQDLRDALSRSDALLVASRESSVAAAGESDDPVDAASRLDVDAIVQGSIARSGDSLRISVRVIDARTDRQAWGGRFGGTVTEVFELQDAMADSVMRAVGQGTSRQRADPLRTATTDVITHNLYLQGRYAAADRTPDALERAKTLFRSAIERDSTYAPAWAALASAHALTGVYEYRSWPELRPEAQEAANRAIRLDARLSEAHSALGVLLDYGFQWDEAERSYLRALQLNPNDAQAHHWYAVSKVLAGHPDQAVGLIEQARHLNPLSFTIAVASGWVHYYGRDVVTAINRLERALDLEPNAWVALQYLGLAYADQGRHEDAVAAMDRARSLNPSAASLLPSLARVYAVGGETGRARELLEEAESENAPMSWLAIGHLALGETDQALDWLERARAAGSWNVIELNTFWYDSIRSHPRFARLADDVHGTPASR